MKSSFKILSLSLLLLLLLKPSLGAQDSSEILKIREQYQAWQKVLNKETVAKGKKFYEISVGKNFSKSEWIAKPESDKDFVWSEVTFIKDDKLGSMFYISETSPSGDWADTAEHYYWPTGELYFVHWRLNTSSSVDPRTGDERPLTIERRFYLNKAGTVIKKLESIYIINTKVKAENPDYMPHDVNYWKIIKALPFYHLLNE